MLSWCIWNQDSWVLHLWIRDKRCFRSISNADDTDAAEATDYANAGVAHVAAGVGTVAMYDAGSLEDSFNGAHANLPWFCSQPDFRNNLYAFDETYVNLLLLI